MLHTQLLNCSRLVYHADAATKSLQSCPTLCDLIDGTREPTRLPHPWGFQARTLQWVAISLVYDKNSRLQRRQVSQRHSPDPRHRPPTPPAPPISATWSQSKGLGMLFGGLHLPLHPLTQNRKKVLCHFRKFDSEALLNLLQPSCFGLKHSELHSPCGSSVRQRRSAGKDGSMVFGEIPISTI